VRWQRHQHQDPGDCRVVAQPADLEAEILATNRNWKINREVGNCDPANRPFDRRPVCAGRGVGSDQDGGKGWWWSTGEDESLDGEVDLCSKPAGKTGAAQELSCQGNSPDWPESRQNGRSRTRV
jgi:hypothetical protein